MNNDNSESWMNMGATDETPLFTIEQIRCYLKSQTRRPAVSDEERSALLEAADTLDDKENGIVAVWERAQCVRAAERRHHTRITGVRVRLHAPSGPDKREGTRE
jgi:hypothetical protein